MVWQESKGEAPRRPASGVPGPTALRSSPAPTLTQDGAGQQGTHGEPHPPGVARSGERRPTRFCAAPLRPAILYPPLRPGGRDL
jgi:hypothetical protein